MLLNTLPEWLSQIGQLIISPGETEFTSLLHTWILVMLGVVLACFLISELSLNYSQVDKLWSLMPMVYGVITIAAFPSSPRLWLMTALTALWGLRLSYNFARKGGYNRIPWKGEEDYRWAVLRRNKFLNRRWKFGLFNLFFISLYQQLLIMLFASPLLIAAAYADNPLSWLDLLAAGFMLLFIGIETVADNQQFRFQTLKKTGNRGGQYTQSLDQGFLSEGLWAYSRHPNFAAEQFIWVSFYIFGMAASGLWLNWSLSGVILLILLFIGSSAMTEGISKGKYPEYAEYQKGVGKFLPFSFRSGRK